MKIQLLNNDMRNVSTILSRKDTRVKNDTRSFKSKFLKSSKEVTIIIAVYNGEGTIQKCIDSVVNQSFPFNKIEMIIVDDCSDDRTRDILIQNSKRHSNICTIYLSENTGTPGVPRNIGIELATSERVLFLDADDWLHRDGIKNLFNKMEETNADFVAGKTIKVTDTSESVHAEFMSYKERTHLEPHKIPYIFYHLGPPSKLIKTNIIKKNYIQFPEMKYAEDKYFFIRVLDNCSSVSTINKPVCYINRMSSNKNSLTRVTDIIDKRFADLNVLKDVVKLGLNANNKKIIIKRLLEYDLIRSCDSNLFIQSKDKETFIQIIKEAIFVVKDLPYDIFLDFDNPLYSIAAELLESDQDNEFIKLFKWKKLEENKRIVIHDNSPYYYIPDIEDKYISIPLFARAIDTYVENQSFIQTFEIYGNKIDTVEHVIIRDRKKVDNEITVECSIDNNIGKVEVKLASLNQLQSSLFSVFIQYDGHRFINIKRRIANKVTYQRREFSLYTTQANNIGFSLKKK